GHPTLAIDLPSQLNSYILGFIEPGGRANMHRHTYESVIVILEGKGHSLIEGQRLDWEAGDAIFTPRWAWHSHINDGDTTVRYLSITNMPMVANLGLMVREEPHAGR
ncbi:MAG TPA: cupin domain-containing protein, partial [bacterium]|nr:cupin domain-containing protein [bacterium]